MKLLNHFKLTKQLTTLGFIALLNFSLSSVQAEPILDIATEPLSNSGPVSVKPNMLYVLDDSISMDWQYMPDWTRDVRWYDLAVITSHPGLSFHLDSAYNTLAYNPAVKYDPPAYYTSTGQKDITTYPSQTGMTAATGADWQSKPNWHSVKYNAYYTNSQNTSVYGSVTNNLETGGPTYQNVEISNPRYVVSIATEYCTRTDLRECVKSDFQTNTHPYPARIRWCNSAAVATDVALPADNACQSVRTGAFVHMRVPLKTGTTPPPHQATITFTDTRNARIDQITINGQRLMRYPIDVSNNETTTAQSVEASIDACTNSIQGNCNVSGYSASINGQQLTIYAPSAVSGTPVLSYSLYRKGRVWYDDTSFSRPSGVATVENRETVDIVPGTTEYKYPGSTTRHPARTDCLSTAYCTYAEEMTNYANWYTYYRTRMQMMKTSTSIAFENIGDDLRMGFMTINSNSSRALDFRDFSGTNKYNWYTKLFSIEPDGSTPLRDALSKAGLIYADKFSLSDVFSDPIQYECQDNFTLLTTDGMWNTTGGQRLDGSAMNNQDNDYTEKGKYDAYWQSNTLADVAKYYRDTDLRDESERNCIGALGSNVCNTTGTSPVLNRKQSMVTFTLGLGVDGTLAYDIDYGPDVAGDFKEIYDGVKPWPWVVENNETTIDDLWHAAVNGDGRYFSAKKTTDLIEQLREAIALIKVKTGAGAAAATSTLNPVSGDNFAYVASYTTGYWKGNLEKREIDITDGNIGREAKACVEDVVPEDNCASPSQVKPDGSGGYVCVTTDVTDPALCTEPLVGSECREPIIPSCFGELSKQLAVGTRTIYMNSGGSLVDFDFTNLTPNQSINFTDDFMLANFTQAGAYTSDQIPNLTGVNLVNYLKGNQTYELDSPVEEDQLFRSRSALLGDLIDSKPSFIGKATFNYGDSGYQDFKNAQATRNGTVYVGSNDGMLHAFDADSLRERWAFVPSAVIPNMWKLADSNYAANHNYYVNGDLTISDICVAADCSTATATDWKTILVAGLDGGGRGYYALDITNPTSPSLLWEIDPNSSGFENLGYTYGNPIVTKRNGDDKWVVIFTSGYNNIPDNNTFYHSNKGVKPTGTSQLQFNTGDGKGYLYVVDAKSGNLLKTIGTGSGTNASPSGLAKIAAFVDNAEINNVSTYVYGGDLDGNIWRFNVSAGGNSVLHLAQLKDENGVVQPVTTPPELGDLAGKKVVFVGTGKYLEGTDLEDSGFSTQSLYALKDVANDGDSGPIYNNPRGVTGVVNQTVVPSTDPTKSDERVSGSNNAVDLAKNIGWYVDFPDSGERQNVASQLVLGTLLVPTTVPKASACQPAGYGWFNYFDYRTGLSVINPFGAVSQRTTAPSVGFNVVYIDGKPKVSNVLADDPNPALVEGVEFNADASGFQFRRSIWRELQ